MSIVDVLTLLFTGSVIGGIFLPLRRLLFWFGLGLIMLAGSYTRFLQAPRPEHIVLGLFLGHILVIMSLCIVRLSIQPVRWMLRLIPALLATYATRVDAVIRYLLVAIYEECLWRGTIQSRLGTSLGAIILTSVLFTLVHLNKRRTVYVTELIDLFLFSAILGCLFTSFNALYLVILVHLVRNVDLSYLGRVVAHPAVEASSDQMIVAKRLTKVFTRQPFCLFRFGRRQEQISKRQAIRAVDAVDLEIPEGTIFGLIGPNGAGKTTLVKVLATLITPTSGTAIVSGFDITTEARKVRAAIGLSVGGERSFYWRLSGWQNLEFFAALQGLAGREAERRIADLLMRLDLMDAKDVAFMKYSTGMKHKLDLARALLMDPPVLLLDEPTSNLDPFAAQTIRATIRDLKQEGKTILLVTHNMYEAEQLCDVFGVMNHGQLMTIGDMPTLRQIIQGRKIRIRLSTPNAPGVYSLAGHVDGGGRIKQNGPDIEIFSPSGKVVINQVLRTIVETGMDVETIQVDEPSLEDVFVELTRSSGCTSP